MTPEIYHGFFEASAGVAGALVGLLFVAVSVTMERMEEQGETQIHRVRAATALTAFSNALSVSLFALIPGVDLGYPAVVVAGLGALFVVGALMSLLRLGLRRPGDLRSALFLVGLTALLVFQLRSGIKLIRDHGNRGAYETIAILVVSCFLIGISRSWELIGGPSIGVAHELFVFGRTHNSGGGAGAGAGGGAAGAGTAGSASAADADTAGPGTADAGAVGEGSEHEPEAREPGTESRARSGPGVTGADTGSGAPAPTATSSIPKRESDPYGR